MAKKFDRLTEMAHYATRDNEDGTYTMFKAVLEYQNGPAPCWFVGGGTFSLSDYPQYEIDWAIESHGLDHLSFEPDEYMVAQALFDNCLADFDLECFGTQREALAYMRKLMDESM